MIEIGLSSSTDSGAEEEHFGIGVTYSFTHLQGHFPVVLTELNKAAAGVAINGENSFFNLGGKSPGVVDFLSFLFSNLLNMNS